MHTICELNCKKAWRWPIIKVETCSLAYIKKELCLTYNSVLYFIGIMFPVALQGLFAASHFMITDECDRWNDLKHTDQSVCIRWGENYGRKFISKLWELKAWMMYNLNSSLGVVGFGTGESDPLKTQERKCLYPTIPAFRKSIALWKSHRVFLWQEQLVDEDRI